MQKKMGGRKCHVRGREPCGCMQRGGDHSCHPRVGRRGGDDESRMRRRRMGGDGGEMEGKRAGGE